MMLIQLSSSSIRIEMLVGFFGQASRDVGDQQNEANENSHLGSRERRGSGRKRDVRDPEQEDQGQNEADDSQYCVRLLRRVIGGSPTRLLSAALPR